MGIFFSTCTFHKHSIYKFNLFLILEEFQFERQNIPTKTLTDMPSNVNLTMWNNFTPTGNLAQSSARSRFEQRMLTDVINSAPSIIMLVVVGVLDC